MLNLTSLAALLLNKEPTNMQAQSLGGLIDKGVARGEFTRFAVQVTSYLR